MDLFDIPCSVGFARFPVLGVGSQSESSDVKGSHRLLEGFFESPSKIHRLADALHLGSKNRVGIEKLLEREAGHFNNAKIDNRFEACRCFADNIVADFIQSKAYSEFR